MDIEHYEEATDDRSNASDPAVAVEEEIDEPIPLDDVNKKLITNWEMHQNVQFLTYLKTKGWGKWKAIAMAMERKLKLPYYTLYKKDKNFLRRKWHTLRGQRSVLAKPFKPAALPSFGGLSDEKKAELESKHGDEQKQAQKLHEDAQGLVKALLAKEDLEKGSRKRTADDLKSKKAQERNEVRAARKKALLEALIDSAKAEATVREGLVENSKRLVELAEKQHASFACLCQKLGETLVSHMATSDQMNQNLKLKYLLMQRQLGSGNEN